jgi:hypothetical protein
VGESDLPSISHYHTLHLIALYYAAKDVITNMAHQIEGFEESKVTIQSFPILTIAQAQTPEVAEGAIEGLKAGVLMNSVTKAPITDKIELVAYKVWRGRAKLPPRSEGTMVECFSPDGVQGVAYGKCNECQFSEFSKDGCKTQMVFIVAPANEPDNLMRLIFWKSNAATGGRLQKLLQSECKRAGVNSIYGITFNLNTKRVKNEASGSYYYVFEVAAGKKVDDKVTKKLKENFDLVTDLRKQSLEDFYNTLKAKADETEEAPEGPEDGLGDVGEIDENGAKLM